MQRSRRQFSRFGLIGYSLLGLLIAFLPSRSFADPDPLLKIILQVKGRDPDIENLRQQMQSQEALAWQQLAPSDPNLAFSANDMDQQMNLLDPTDAGSWVYSISQSLNFPGKALLGFSQVNDQAQSLSYQLRATELQVSANVKSAYYQLVLARKNIALNQEQEGLYEQIVNLVKQRFEAASVTEVDLANAQMAQYSNEAALADLRLAEASALAQLNVLLGQAPDAEIQVGDFSDPASFPKIDEAALAQSLEKKNLQIQSAAYAASAARKGYGLAWMGLLPNFQFSITDNQYHQPAWAAVNASPVAPNIETHSFSVQANFPVWLFLNDGLGIDAARHGSLAADAALESQREASENSLAGTLRALDDNKTKLEIYQDHLLPLSELSLKQAMVNYGSGKIQFTDLANAAGALWSVRSTYFGLLASQAATYTQLGQLLGEEW